MPSRTHKIRHYAPHFLAVLILLALTACASVPQDRPVKTAQELYTQYKPFIHTALTGATVIAVTLHPEIKAVLHAWATTVAGSAAGHRVSLTEASSALLALLPPSMAPQIRLLLEEVCTLGFQVVRAEIVKLPAGQAVLVDVGEIAGWIAEGAQ